MQELSSSYCHWSVRRINQVINVLTVLIGQGVFTAPAAHYQITQHSPVEEHKIDNISMHVCKRQGDIFKMTHCRMSVTSLMASTATSYSLSRVIDTIRSCHDRYD